MSYVNTIRERPVKARKPHRCELCCARIEVGDMHQVQTNVYDGRIYNWRECTPCETDGIVNLVHDWTGGYHDEGIDGESAHEWAHENVDTADCEAANAYLKRHGCKCDAE